MRSTTWLLVSCWLAMVQLSVQAAESSGDALEATIDVSKTGPAINPFIYGQFIEHLGRCIYGGIWAEMLEDRKFYFPITDEYDPYRDLTDSEFPVVGASPWEVLGPPGSVQMSTADPFVGEHAPLVAPGSGIRQNDLGIAEGKKYNGHIWVRAPSGDATIKISLGVAGKDELPPIEFNVPSQDHYAEYDFSFDAPPTPDKGYLAIRVEGAPVLIGTVSLMPEDNVRGFRADTLALLKQLGATIYRWPGGNFVSGYDWRDGIGPRDRRPPRKNPAWTGVEHNDVGLDEFVDFCREVGAEPMIAVNTGFGDDYSAAQEVEYCNGSADTIGGSWRVENGHAEPYGVKYWCVGNEMFGNWQLGHMHLNQYTQKHNRVARAMRVVDPNIRLVGSGDLGTMSQGRDGRKQRSWSQGMLEDCGDHMDYISEHFYCGRLPWSNEDDIPTLRHVGMLREEIRKKAEGERELQRKVGRAAEDVIPIAMDEWNFWHRTYKYGELGCQYDLADALGVAAGLHEYFRNTDIIDMAHYAQTVNVIGCIKTSKTDAFFSTTALPLMLYRREFGDVPLAVTGSYGDASLDVAAALADDGRALTVGIVNPNESAQTVQLNVDGATVGRSATVWRITGPEPTAVNTADNQPVAIQEEQGVPFGKSLTVPPYSVSLYRVAVE